LGAQTLSVRQSSLVCSAPLPGGTRGGGDWEQEAPKSTALRGCFQLAGDCGARQRSSSTGAAAYGTPLNDEMPALTVPTSAPLSIWTLTDSAREHAGTHAIHAIRSTRGRAELDTEILTLLTI
jgi:hypothetical protein